MSFFVGFADELVKLAKPKQSLTLGAKLKKDPYPSVITKKQPTTDRYPKQIQERQEYRVKNNKSNKIVRSGVNTIDHRYPVPIKKSFPEGGTKYRTSEVQSFGHLYPALKGFKDISKGVVRSSYSRKEHPGLVTTRGPKHLIHNVVLPKKARYVPL